MKNLKEKFSTSIENLKDVIDRFLSEAGVIVEWQDIDKWRQEKTIFKDKKVVLPSNFDLAILPLIVFKLEKEIFGQEKSHNRFKTLAAYFWGVARYFEANLPYITDGQEMATYFISFFKEVSEKISGSQLEELPLISDKEIESIIFGSKIYQKIEKNSQLKIQKLNQLFRILSLLYQRNHEIKNTQTYLESLPFLGQSFLEKIELNLTFSLNEIFKPFWDALLKKIYEDIKNLPSKDLSQFYKKIFNKILGIEFELLKIKDKLQPLLDNFSSLTLQAKIERLKKIIHVIHEEFSYQRQTGTIGYLLKERKLNCVTISFLLGSIFDDLNIDYANVAIPGHVFLVCNLDNDLYFVDGANEDRPLILQISTSISEKKSEIIARIKEYVTQKSLSSGILLTYLGEEGQKFFYQFFNRQVDYLHFSKPPGSHLTNMFTWLVNSLVIDAFKNNNETSLNLAEKIILEAKKYDPIDTYLDLILAEIYKHRGNYLEAIKMLEGHLQYNKNNAYYHNLLGELYRLYGNYQKAEFYFKEAVNLSRGDALFYYLDLARFYFDNKKYDEAIDVCLKALELNFKKFDIYVILGLSYFAKGDLTNAEKYFLQAYKQNSKDVFVLKNLIKLYLTNLNYDKVIEFSKKLLHFESSDVFALESLGKAFLFKGNLRKAEKFFKKLIQFQPDNYLAYYYLGLIYFRLKKFSLAYDNFEKFLSFNPQEKDYVDSVQSMMKLMTKLKH